MKIHRIAVIAGDGIGPEVIAEGIKVLEAAAKRDGSFAFEFEHFLWGCEYYLKTGRMMPADALETLKKFDAIFLGAVGYPGVPDHISLRDLRGADMLSFLLTCGLFVWRRFKSRGRMRRRHLMDKMVLCVLAAALLPALALADFNVYFLRHGETNWNREKRLQGSVSNTVLTAEGVRMAEETADGMREAGLGFDRVYTSPYARARDTARIVSRKTGPEPVADRRLREMCFGKYEGLHYGAGNYPDENLRLFFEGDADRYVPQGNGAETFAQVQSRLRDFLENELRPQDGKVTNILCVAHSLVLKSLVRELAGDGAPAAAKRTIQPNCCVHVVRYEGGKFSLVEAGRAYGRRRMTAPEASGRPDLARLVAEDIVRPVRPGGADGRPFWNGHALWFMYPPAFGFKEVKGARNYRFSVRDNFQREWTMTAAKPTAPIVDVWTNLPPGLTVATCYGVDAAGEVVGLAGSRSFWKQAPYRPGSYPKAKRSYREAAHRLLRFLVNDWKPAQVLGRTGKPDVVYQYNGYPAKIGSALVNIMLMAARELPELSGKALDLARKEADYLISITPKEGPLAYFTPTYEYHPEAVGPNRHAPNACKRYLGQCMIRYCAEVGIAMLRLAEATGEGKYADFAVRCGETFLRLQRPDGTWPCMLRYSDGAAMRRDDIILIERINFFAMLRERTGDARYARLEADVFAQLERQQMTTWDWQGQFEDTPLNPEPYKDLTGTDALPAACYILKKFPGDARRLAQAVEMVRYGEDQFTCWERPYRADGGSPSMGQMVEGKWYDSTYASWHCPGVGEQYACMVPIDASACRMIWGYLALYRATGDELCMAKARTLGDSIVNKQQENGGIETYWYETGMRQTDDCAEIDWLDCMMDDAEALLDLARIE